MLCVVARVARLFRPGDDLEVLCLREVCAEEPTAAGLSKGEPTSAEDIEMPQLRIVLLSRAGDHAEVETRDLVCIEEAATGLLYKSYDSLNLSCLYYRKENIKNIGFNTHNRLQVKDLNTESFTLNSSLEYSVCSCLIFFCSRFWFSNIVEIF